MPFLGVISLCVASSPGFFFEVLRDALVLTLIQDNLFLKEKKKVPKISSVNEVNLSFAFFYASVTLSHTPLHPILLAFKGHS